MYSSRAATRSVPRSIAETLLPCALLLLPNLAWAVSTRTLLHLTGDMANPNYGYSVNTAGDVNGDGYTDFIVGAPGYIYSTGQARVYFGGPGLDDVADLTLTGEAAGDQFGFRVASAGDMNGDGYTDVIVGARGAATGRGRAYVYFGGPNPDASADLTMTGGATQDAMGFDVASLGDVNRDGYDDVIVGMPGYNGDQGQAFTYFGGPTPDANPDVTMTGGAAGDFFGRGARAAGDVNGDGFGDIVVSALQYPPGQTGRVYVFLGGHAPDAIPDVITTGDSWGYDQLGLMVGTAGDINADGYTDWMAGAYGADQLGHVYVYYGGPNPDGTRDMDIAGEFINWRFGETAGAGDFDGDGFQDIVVGAPGGQPGHVWVKGIYPYQVLAPNGGEQWVAGQRSVVRWRGHDPADLAISYDGGSSWSTIASGIGGLEENEYEVVVPSIPTEFARVRLSYTGQTVKRATSDASDGVFRIVTPVRAPAAAHRLQIAPAGTAPSEYFGLSVSGAGDVNGDGYSDVIVGAQGFNNSQGRATVYFGGPGGDAIADLTMTGEGPFQYFGVSVGSAGDVNGDGYPDLIVGAQEYAGSTGRAYVYHGGPAADGVADWTLTGLASGHSFGCSVGTAGDVNGDGYADVIVGAFGYNGGIGRAYVFFGGPGADTLPDVTLTGASSAGYFGGAVSTAGDVNGDGYSDVIVGAQNVQSGQGAAYVYHGGPSMDAVADWSATGEAAANYFGIAVGAAGDVNGDGFGEIIVGANNAQGGRGRAYVYRGGSDADARADWVLTGPDPTSRFGSSVGTAGDVNGDGYPDLLAGGWGGPTGCALVYYGGPTADNVPDHTITGEVPNTLFGVAASTAGDWSGDGYADVIVGAYGMDAFQGRAYVYDFNRYFVTSPNGGETWNVGATKSITWLGAEKADVWLSTDAGKTYDLLASGRGGAASNAWAVRVPHSPGKFTMVKVTPSDPTLGGFDRSDSMFTVQTSVALLALTAAPAPDRAGAAVVTWNTDPGPEDLAGYRLEKAGAGDSWLTVVPLTRETSYTDEDAGAGGSRYRLFAVNGFGEELMLGEAALRPSAALAAWPSPYRGGGLTISFATASGPGGAPAPAEISVFDVSGRLVRTVARGDYGSGYRTVIWDGRGVDGRNVAAGMYFIRARTAGHETTVKLPVLR